ncbi:SDR family NAD(P)-dependent oxidoreductase [Cellulophaga baltica]|uniref:SDR family NAD(P)-dependent oxidoreductase n=1 Tax=Cellulophaga TaxID=104264 RepID=UPI001C0780EE|nr:MULTISPECIES: SDR family NAD(P)-dependent oxidoreductase [Cellulophaga]MBU2995734.1 SDR family NAD(P)-dependent oxidoreductase [Cellulophaga baltica]MDO6767128.1 SDR family NAD(P)-dependent oxidoreductase [Cellulophaga sp. 1_MG-2023]
MKNKNKTAFITGATSGIGEATAKLFASNGINLILCGRRKEKLEVLQKELSDKTEVYILSFDIKNKKAVFEAVESLPKEFSEIDILINNAGNAHGLEPINEGDTDDWDAMIDINVKGLLYVSKAIAPKMVEKKSGHIINIGSTAAKEVYPNGGVYCATKHAVDALNQAMRIDLHKHGIRVGAVHPGLVETEFSKVRFKGDESRADNVYKGFDPLTPEDIADVVHFVVTRPYYVNITDLVIVPNAQATATILTKE